MPHFDATTEEEVNKLIAENEGVAIIDFHASWCGPCKIIGPKAVALSDSTGILLIKIDVDQAEELAAKMAVSSMPTFFAVKDTVSNVLKTMVGANAGNLEKLYQTAVENK
jgi:thioredoxin 1